MVDDGLAVFDWVKRELGDSAAQVISNLIVAQLKSHYLQRPQIPHYYLVSGDCLGPQLGHSHCHQGACHLKLHTGVTDADAG